MNRIPKFVASTTLRETTWNATVIDGDVATFVDDLKRKSGQQNLLKYGNGPLDATLMQHGLIDEFHLFLTPVAVGKSRHLSADIDTAPHLALVNVHPIRQRRDRPCLRAEVGRATATHHPGATDPPQQGAHTPARRSWHRHTQVNTKAGLDPRTGCVSHFTRSKSGRDARSRSRRRRLVRSQRHDRKGRSACVSDDGQQTLAFAPERQRSRFRDPLQRQTMRTRVCPTLSGAVPKEAHGRVPMQRAMDLPVSMCAPAAARQGRVRVGARGRR